MKKLAGICITVVSVFLLAAHAIAIPIPVGFEGTYDPSNWDITLTNSDGDVDTSYAPESISIIGSDIGRGGSGDTDFTITSPGDGIVSFDWFYTTEDVSPIWDPFGFLINGNFEALSLRNQSGSSSFMVSAGDIFGFRIHSVDNIFGPGMVDISNFSGPDSAPIPNPEPATLILLGSGLVGLGGATRRKLKK